MAEDADFDRELLARVRAGEDTAFGELFSRHSDAVRRFALRHVREHAEAEDLTAEAFFRVLQAIRRGNGPTDHVRTYLLTVARRVAWEWSGRRRDVPVADEELSRRVEPFPDATADRAEHTLISRAFTSLPERWRSVLWRVEVEGERPAAVAPHFGLSPNAMAALARRAREGLRAAYLQAHLAAGADGGPRACSSVVAKLGTYTAGGVQGAEQLRIRKHLRTCASCNALHAELVEVCSTLRAHAAMLAVPVAATAVIAPHATAAITAIGGVAGRLKLVLTTAASAAAVGLFGMVAGTFTGGPGPALVQPGPNARHGEDVLALASTTTAAEVTVTGEATSRARPHVETAARTQRAATGTPPSTTSGGTVVTSTTPVAPTSAADQSRRSSPSAGEAEGQSSGRVVVDTPAETAGTEAQLLKQSSTPADPTGADPTGTHSTGTDSTSTEKANTVMRTSEPATTPTTVTLRPTPTPRLL
ncbi:RNA polymerase sigma factor (sigma-70 family) [Saccharothrix coeruleofusca]|uniref:sigma-70 family RNA polymerase sigma factor n=1 Tax=Saccharothrix coeruleofusca TaxID=33919 RepID=UPI001AE3AA91|nr:sigma-70 family RNA polymerase sigma factor [Saccharothrix coeruleofusca]MBP2340039.1 RNA polymerase sigma factor (sigma-70 family) [Saccharothrix coeruleofusca]